MSVENKLFIYGTLIPGEVNAHLLAPLKGSYVKASIKGSIHIVQSKLHNGLRGLFYEPLNENHVNGYLFESDDLPNFWHELDEFEGDEFPRIEVNVTLEDGAQVDCYAYIYSPHNE